MTKLRGDVVLRGSIAYVPQTAYIVNATLKVSHGSPCSACLWTEHDEQPTQSHLSSVCFRTTCCSAYRSIESGTRVRSQCAPCKPTSICYLQARRTCQAFDLLLLARLCSWLCVSERDRLCEYFWYVCNTQVMRLKSASGALTCREAKSSGTLVMNSC